MHLSKKSGKSRSNIDEERDEPFKKGCLFFNSKMISPAEATEKIINRESVFTEGFVQEPYNMAGESVRSLIGKS